MGASSDDEFREVQRVMVDGVNQTAGGQLASGSVDGVRWTAAFDETGAICYWTVDPVKKQVPGCVAGGPQAPGSPVNFAGIGGDGLAFATGYVRQDVSSLVVDFADGESVRLEPRPAAGGRFVAYVKPVGLKVARLTAQTQDGVRYSIPFNDPTGYVSALTWYRPGDDTQGTSSGPIGSGSNQGKAWNARVYIGPYGQCVVVTGAGDLGASCTSVDAVPSQDHPHVEYTTVSRPTLIAAEVGPAVARVVVELADGSQRSAPLLTVANRVFFASVIDGGAQTVSVKFYGDDNALLATTTPVTVSNSS